MKTVHSVLTLTSVICRVVAYGIYTEISLVLVLMPNSPFGRKTAPWFTSTSAVPMGRFFDCRC